MNLGKVRRVDRDARVIILCGSSSGCDLPLPVAAAGASASLDGSRDGGGDDRSGERERDGSKEACELHSDGLG